jgi:urate oxidase
MSIKIISDNYGKARVRLLKVDRRGGQHDLMNLSIRIALEGDFETIHTVGDNSLCLPTDTMKNTVYALAAQVKEIEEIEAFGRRLADHFIKNNEQVSRATITLTEHRWERMEFGGEEHSHAFTQGSGEKHIAKIDATRSGVVVESGVEDLIVLKTTGSGFAGFIKDPYTTLPETTDRIFSTAIKAVWRYKNADAATREVFDGIRQTILETFAAHDSLSVQHTLYAMGEAVLGQYDGVEEISFSLPNIHFLPVDVSRFGLENDNCIFLPTDEPHGLIEATLGR